MGRVSG